MKRRYVPAAIVLLAAALTVGVGSAVLADDDDPRAASGPGQGPGPGRFFGGGGDLRSPGNVGRLLPAPIDAVDIQVRESHPPQVSVRILSGLPNGCTRFEEARTKRNGTTVEIAVLNRAPAEGTMCTQVYGQVETQVNLGSDFVPGTTYSIVVNGHVVTYRA